MLTPAQKEFDDLSPEAQAIVRKEFADRPQELQSFIQRKSPTGSISKDAQKIIDDATDVIYGKKKTMPNGVDVKVSATMPSNTVITADTNGVVAVDASFTPDVANVTDMLSKRTGLKFGYAEYYQNGKRNNAYNGHYDPTTKTIYFRKGASKAEIIYQTAVHELTHFAESSKHYKYVSDYVLNKKYEGVDSDAYKKAVKEKIAAYAKNGIELTPEEARRELVAENIREVIFKSKKDVDKLVRTDYTFAQRILDIIDSFIYHFNNKFGRLEGDAKIHADLEQAQRKYRLALASAKGMRGASGRNISYDIKMDYRHQVDLALDKKLKSGLSVYMGKASKFLTKFGLDPDLPMLMNQSHLRDINHKKSSANIHWHGLSREIIKQIPSELKNPVMVYDSISPQNSENSICVVTSLKDPDGFPVIVSIRVEGEGNNRYLNLEAVEQTSEGANFVTSAYGKKDFVSHIAAVISNDALLYANKNKTHQLFSDSELHLLTRLNNLGFDRIIHPSRNIVKSENKNSFSFSSPKSDTEESIFDADVPMRHIDDSVRTYAEYKAEQDAAAQAAEAEVAHQSEKQDAKSQIKRDFTRTVDEVLTVDDATAKREAEARTVVEIRANTPSVILDHVEGSEDLPIIMNYNKFYLAVRHGGIFDGHYHDLGPKIAKRLPELLENPDAIIQLSNGRLNILSEVSTDRGKNGIISIELSDTKDIDKRYQKYNVVVTMFSSDDAYVENLLSGEGVRVKYQREDLSQVNPQLYKWLAIINDKSSLENSISPMRRNVKNDGEQDFTPAPGVEKSPTDNPDVAAIVNADGNKRTDDIELQYSQRLKGKNSMLFKDISRVLDYVCDKMPGVRDFWRNRIEKPFWRAKASFTSRSRQYLTDLKTTADKLGIRIGSKESASAHT